MVAKPILLDFPEHWLGERVLVRSWRPGDGPALFEAVDESRANLAPWIPWVDHHPDIQASEETARRLAAAFLLREDLTVSIWDQTSGRLLGGSGLHRIDWQLGRFEIGYWLRTSAAGHGYASETVRLLTRIAFEDLDAQRVFLRCAVANLRSSAVAQRAGLNLEGSHPMDIQVGNELADGLVYGLTRDQWMGAR